MKSPLISIKNLHISVSTFLPEQLAAGASFLQPGSVVPAAPATPARDALTPPAIGAYWEGQGGVYAGMMRGEEGLPDYPLIVPIHKSVLNHKAAYGGGGIDEPGAISRFDGLANTLALVASETEHPAAQWCRTLEVEGHNDLYLPSILELALIAANLPDLLSKEWHLSSSQRSANLAFTMVFDDGGQSFSVKGHELRVRPVRRFIR